MNNKEIPEEKKFILTVSGEHEAAYLKIPGRPEGEDPKVASSLRLIDLKPDYKGAEVVLDFGADGKLIGIEVLADD